MRWFLIFFVSVPLLWANGVEDRISAIASDSPAARRGFWGATVLDLDTGETVYERNAGKLFVPASNLKLFTSAVALDRLGPEHRFRTRIYIDSEPDENGVVAGDLVFHGGGDPTLSPRKVPYVEGPVRGDPLAPLRDLADLIAAQGIKRIDGDIIGDDSAYVWEPYADGWSQEDISWEYGAPVSALTLHDNSFKVSVYAAKTAGAPARLFFKPAVEYYLVHNHVKTISSGESRITIDWPLCSRELHLWGAVTPKAPRAKLLAVRDPAHYAAWVLSQALAQRGIEHRGEIRAKKRWLHDVPNLAAAKEPPPEPTGILIIEQESPPLHEILQVVNKVSQNLHAELTLREVGLVTRNIGSREAGLAELGKFLAEIGVGKTSYHFEDASGLSTMNLVSPATTVRLLQHMHLSEDRDGWLELMAIGGEDGTLDYRFRSPATRGRVLAKTGTLTGASALSGYLETASGRTLAFSIMLNNYNTKARPARQFIDAVVTELLKE